METHETRSPASSITRLGVKRFIISQDPPAPGGGPRSDAIVELPSFSNQETSRPTVQMPPLVDERVPVPIDEAFDPSPDDGAPPAVPRRGRTSTLRGVAPPVPAARVARSSTAP